MTLNLSIIAFVTFHFIKACNTFDSTFICDETQECEYDDTILCTSSSNCSIECSGNYSCQYSTLNGYYAHSLYVDASWLSINI